MLVVNLGPELVLASPAVPLQAPPAGASWEIVFASEDPRYGGAAVTIPKLNRVGGWPSKSAIPAGKGRRRRRAG